MAAPRKLETDLADWYLEGHDSHGQRWLVQLERLPFTIGRLEDNDLCLSSSGISRHHAEIYVTQEQLWIRECGSTNGTFLNRQRILKAVPLQAGDILHFGSVEFRINRKGHSASSTVTQALNMQIANLPMDFVQCEAEFMAMLQQRAVVPYFQPLVRLADANIVGHEVLGRCDFAGIPSHPVALLRIAASLGRGVELSELFREAGVAHAQQLGEQRYLFVNTMPQEVELERLSRSLHKLRRIAPTLPLVLEIHEAAVTDLGLMEELRSVLRELKIELAYDDFGAGQARLVELITVTPDWLKFDISLIHTIHQQPPRSRRVLQTLVTMARDLGIKTLAEGVELEPEAEVCLELGFDYAQGYYYGHPEPNLNVHD